MYKIDSIHARRRPLRSVSSRAQAERAVGEEERRLQGGE